MGTLAMPVDEEVLVRGAVETLAAPPGVRLGRINPDYVDSTGDQAVQVIFAVTKKIPSTKKRMIELNRFVYAVEEAISSLRLSKWPLVNFVEVR